MPNSSKPVILAGIGAMVLSAVVGLFSPVHGGVVMFRALVAGVAVSAVMWGVQWLLWRFLPELFAPIEETSAKKTEREQPSAEGNGRLNIVLEGEEVGEPVVDELEEPGEDTGENEDRMESEKNDESAAELGSISQFSDFSAGENAPETVHLSKSNQSTGNGHVNLGTDPKEIARALQTMMKRDE